MTDQLPNVDVVMLHRDLSQVPFFPLPPGYRMRGYRDGDLETWLQIQATDSYFVPTAETFAATLPGDAAHLASRVMFLVAPEGEEIGSITAWNAAELTGQDIGQIHWVALVPAARGRGLSKPMLSAACAVLRDLGYREAFLETNTRRIPAVNLYRQFGFTPFPRSEAEREAWQAIAPYLKVAS